MTASELAEHAGYLGDKAKLKSYGDALEAVVADGREVVLDLGAGSGILGLLAARAGARRVYAVDSGPIVGAAAEVAARSEHANVIVHVRGRSNEIDLPERVDIAVCDQIGGFVHDAGVLEYFADVRRRHLSPSGILMPCRFELFLAPVRCERLREQVDLWRSSPGGFDFSPFAELAVNSEHRFDPEDLDLLAPGVRIGVIDADHTDPIQGEGQVVVEVEDRCDGLVGWFVADLGGGGRLTNQPDAADRIARWCNVYPITTGVDLRRGDVVDLSVDVRPALHAVTWRVAIRSGAAEPVLAAERHSTLLGAFLDGEDLARSSGSPIIASALGQALARAIELADGTQSTDDVLDVVGAEFPVCADSQPGHLTLRRLLARFSMPT